jgi:glycine/D-amino acid oxidase-like deaminating enzyme
MSVYDYVIIGAGLAGLHCARRLLDAQPHLKVIILEKYNYIGGRVVTFRRRIPGVGPVQWENGAGRVHSTHRLVRSYMSRYGLTWSPIDDDYYVQDRDGDDLRRSTFPDRMLDYFTPLQFLPDGILQKSTIEKLLTKVVGSRDGKQLLSEFPYRAEVNTLRADEGLRRMLATDDVVGGDFGVCVEGLDKIVEGIAADVTDAGATILLGTTVDRIIKQDGSPIIYVETNTGTSSTKRIFMAHNVISALHSNAMKYIEGLADWPLLNAVAMRPLLRIYAVFPKPLFLTTKVVFASNPLRYYIPIDVARGICMISYTDADDTQTWMRDASAADLEPLEKKIMACFRRAFPLERIPDPIYLKSHPWRDGCTYWLPVAKAATAPVNATATPVNATAEPIPEGPHQIKPNIWACGESFSPDKQCWMEGALESAEQLVQHLIGDHN